jgi:hypothetical protein
MLATDHDVDTARHGNVESWRKVLSRDSIVLWHVRSFAARVGAVPGAV